MCIIIAWFNTQITYFCTPKTCINYDFGPPQEPIFQPGHNRTESEYLQIVYSDGNGRLFFAF